MRYVLDTNTLLYFFKGLGKVSDHLLSIPPSEIGLPAIVLFELEVGIGKSKTPKKRKSQLNEFASLVNILSFGYEEAKCAANIRVKLEKKGLPIGPYDILIAASALAGKSILVTHNVAEFRRIDGLRTEDWY